ncbi:hypothetical protein BaRGS_00035433, partial [Batillaria attramentaria]
MSSQAGTRVLRGPDWDAGDVDGGEGFLGTVTEVLSNQKVRVLWDNGEESTCRTGSDGKFDLRVFDTAPSGVRHTNTKCAECGEEDILGTLWRCRECSGSDLCTPCYSDDKHDLRHPFLRIDSPGDQGCVVPKRKTGVKIRAIGIFPGATVTRGRDWNWGDQDGGQGSEGEVKGYQNMAPDSSRNLVIVDWSNGTSNYYRLGFQGQVDLTCVEEEVGPYYYRDHLATLDTSSSFKSLDEAPELDSTESDNLTAILQGLSSTEATQQTTPSATAGSVTSHSEASPSPPEKQPETVATGAVKTEETSKTTGLSKDTEIGASVSEKAPEESGDIFCCEDFVPGDKVTIRVGEEKLKELQKTAGGCTARMVRCIGRSGEVTGVSDKKIVSVKFGSASQVSYRFNPAALMKMAEIKEGDTVRIKPDIEQVKQFNSRVGWNYKMDATVGKVGRVTKVDDDGDLVVSFGGCRFTYAPACCVATSDPPDTINGGGSGSQGGAADAGVSTCGTSIDGGEGKESMKLFKMMRDAVLGESSKGHGRSIGALFAAINMGADDDVRDMCQRDPSLVEREYQGITPLIYASLRGERACVMALLNLGADVNKCGDNPRKTPMSAVIEGKSEEIAELLLARGVDTTHLYGDGHTLAHLATLRNKPFCIRALARHGADMNAKDRFEDTPLHIAIEQRKDKALEALVSLPEVNINIGNTRDFDAIQLASLMDNTRALELLLARDTSGIERLRKGHSSALTIAASNDHVECIRLLVFNFTVSPFPVDKWRGGKGLTALHVACHLAKLPSVEALLELGAEVNVHDEDGDTPLHLAIGGRIEGYGK